MGIKVRWGELEMNVVGEKEVEIDRDRDKPGI